MGYSLTIIAYCQTCNRSHRAKDNEHRRTFAIPERINNLKTDKAGSRHQRRGSVFLQRNGCGRRSKMSEIE